mmetsp:Transcript_26740/g.61490  ORF Transcript_26740/g.61490 Transcript_26740/m.61490 type:complete len:215 (-) Transcript_26740:77-721(-)
MMEMYNMRRWFFRSSLLVLLVATAQALITTAPHSASIAWKVSNDQCRIAHTTDRILARRTRSTALLLEPASDAMLSGATFPEAPVLVVLAIGIFAAAQSLINQQLDGDQGLGAFLRDGSGYSKSGFRPIASDNERALGSDDPLPWLKLPRLDFVDVVGQEESPMEVDNDVVELENLRMQLNEYLAQGNVTEANTIQRRMLEIMQRSGIEYQSEK